MQTARLAFPFVLTLLFSACGSKHEAAADESVQLMERIGTMLESVKDEASAKAAAVKLEPMMTRMQELRGEMEAMGGPKSEEGEALAAKYEARMQAAMGKMMKEGARVMADPKLSAILQPVMSKMGN